MECLLDFARRHGLVSSLDVYVSRNTLLDLFGLAEPWEGPVPAQTEPAPTAILDGLLDAAAARGLFDASAPARRPAAPQRARRGPGPRPGTRTAGAARGAHSLYLTGKGDRDERSEHCGRHHCAARGLL